MSAIVGILKFDGGEASRRDLERAGAALTHRGPDGCRIVVDGPVGLGHCLMRVNREDIYEVQPLRDREIDITVTADLRLDNREDLASELGIGTAGVRDLSDSALLARAYARWGAQCAEHLVGDFAFAIWDGRAKQLVLGRDHMGQRYVHYHLARTFFVFATDVTALWSYPGVPRQLLEAQIGRMLTASRTAPPGETPFEDIHGLPGATVMTVGANGVVATRRYWEPHADPAHEGHREPYYVEAYRHVLGEAVSCRIRRTIRPAGLFFSGGYDSAAIAGLAGPMLAGTGRKLVAASSVMPADYRGTIRHARRWVEMCARDMPHLDVRYVTREGTSVLSGLEEAFLSGGPAGPYHFVMTELLSTLAGAGAQVIMDGHGGDYTLHPRGQAALARFLATRQFRRFLPELRGHLRLTGRSWWTTLREDLAVPLLPASLLALWRRARHGFAPVWRDRPINPAFARRLIAEGVVNRSGRSAARPRIEMRAQMAGVARRIGLGPAPGIAMAAARHGLELTRPFHDKRVVELGLAIPEDLYVKNGRNRYLPCAALKGVYPPEFETRGRRNDDEIPDFQRMATSIAPQLLAEIARMEHSGTLARYVDFGKVRTLLAARGTDDHNSGWEPETQSAMLGFVVARYVEWFRRDNR